MDRRTTASVLNEAGTTYTLEQMADTSEVTLYTTEPCGFCSQAKTLLQRRGVQYTEVNLAQDPGGAPSWST